MSTISGVAKLANNDPASEVVATHIAGRAIYRAVPAGDGSYGFIGVPAGTFLVTARGPAGYRPVSHEVEVPVSPEAVTLWPKVLSAWDFESTQDSTQMLYDRKGANPFAGNVLSIVGHTSNSYGIDSLGIVRSSTPQGVDGVAIAVAVWFRYRPGGDGNEYIWSIGTGDSTGNERFSISAFKTGAARELVIAVRNSSGSVVGLLRATDHAGLTFADNTWTFGVFSFKAGAVKAWVNGVPAGQKSMPIAQLSNFSQMVLGYNFSGSPKFDSLDRDDMLLLVDEPTDDEVAYLYAQGQGRTWQDIRADGGYG